MNDTMLALAHNGRSRCPTAQWWELAESHPQEYWDLILNRYLANLFSPLWGELFEGDANATDHSIHQ